MNPSTHTDLPAENSSLFLARQVHALRKKAGLTLQQLSRKSDVSVSTLSKIEKGQLSPTYEKIVSLARGLDVPIAALFHEESAHRPNGRLAVTRAGSARTHSTKQYD